VTRDSGTAQSIRAAKGAKSDAPRFRQRGVHRVVRGVVARVRPQAVTRDFARGHGERA